MNHGLNKSKILSFILISAILLCSACSVSSGSASSVSTQATTTEASSSLTTFVSEASNTESITQTTVATSESVEKTEEMLVKITAGDHVITAVLYDNAAGRAFWDMLPITLPMMNLYEREMCYRFGAGTLPEDEAEDLGYEIGDISYWPPAGSLVILYEQNGEVFEQQPIGHTNDDVSFFVGMSDTDITFEKAD